MTSTNDAEPHTDVSLWYPLLGNARDPLAWDDREFHGVRWWTASEIAVAPAQHFDPHLARFLAKHAFMDR
jgi:hypothetical protein